MQTKLVSIIIPVYNRSQLALETINSALAQSHEELEIIIVDDGSTDDTRSIIEPIVSKHENVQLLIKKNGGPGSAREFGRAKAKGMFIQFLDSDDLLHPHKIAAQVDSLEKNPDCHIAYTREQLCSLDGKVISDPFKRSAETFDTLFPAILGGRIWSTSNPLYRRTTLSSIGAWSNLINEEDWEYDSRTAKSQVRLCHIKATLTTTRSHDLGHFGKIDTTEKLQDRFLCRKKIYTYAHQSKVDLYDKNFKAFMRSNFFLVRQLSALGLKQEAIELLAMIEKFSANTKRETFEYMIYRNLSRIFGWRTLGRLSTVVDKLRP